MRIRIAAAGLLALGLASPAVAQTLETARPKVDPPAGGFAGYFMGGTAGIPRLGDNGYVVWVAGAGLEHVSRIGLGAGAEGTVFFDTSGHALFLPSAVVVARLRPTRQGVQPFVSGGYTAFTNLRDAVNGWNVGGGITWWSPGKAGLRLELRDYVASDYEGWSHFMTVRVGVSLR